MKTVIEFCVVHGLQCTDYELQQSGSSRVPVFEALAMKFLFVSNQMWDTYMFPKCIKTGPCDAVRCFVVEPMAPGNFNIRYAIGFLP